VRALLVLFLALPLAAQTTTPEERGRQIFEHGTSTTGGAITASIGAGDPVAASILPCANCHGVDGLGRSEGGVVPANVTWDALTKPYGMQRADGRKRPPYTERLVKRAITMGLDPNDGELLRAMPRYRLSLSDAADLIAYLKVLGQSADPGLTDTGVRIGVLLPPGKDAAIVRESISRQFADVNRRGGIFGRTLELAVVDVGVVGVFAVCGSFSGIEREIAAAAAKSGMPAIATVAAEPDLRAPLNPYVFYLDGGKGQPSADPGQQLWDRAAATAEILVEGMRRAGRALTRHSLVEALEGLTAVKTSLPEAITFSPTRRVGIADHNEPRQ
jgi:hypothetical protein